MKQTLEKNGENKHTLEYSSSPRLCGASLNSPDEKGQCDGLTTFSNPPKRNQPEVKTSGQALPVVYVFNIEGQPLMPCSPTKAKHLLKKGKAHVVSRLPFTIQLTYETTNYTQSIEVGLDEGYKTIGISARTDKKELYSAEFELRTDIVKKISEKRMYRRSRRGRNTRYRKPRFNNRSKPKGWLPPSVQHRYDSHIKAIKLVQKLLPITHITLEGASFDIQKINNPDISGKEYQEGPQKEYYNTRAYVLYRDGYKCVNCGTKDNLRVHHIESRQTGGNLPDNLISLCKKCHEDHHAGKKIRFNKTKSFRAETFMSIIRKRIVNDLRILGYSVNETYGYITQYNRKEQRLEKTHANDAFIISGGTEQTRCQTFTLKEKRRNNRAIQLNRKGYKPQIRRKRYNYQPEDVVMYEGKKYKVVGVHNYGKAIRLKTDKEVINGRTKNVKIVKYNRGIYYKKEVIGIMKNGG